LRQLTGSAFAFFHEALLLVEFQRQRGDAVYVLIVEPLGMSTGHAQEAGDGRAHTPSG
jgi:hypothetical protein